MFFKQGKREYQSWVAAPWFSSANRMPTLIECFRNFSAHRLTQVSSCFCKFLCLKESTQSLKHLSTRELYILKLQIGIRKFHDYTSNNNNQSSQAETHSVREKQKACLEKGLHRTTITCIAASCIQIVLRNL
ncbi:hypothetical protein EUGRSUZ_K01685 [Eucalyptus grandis]|uniref:Uncharacterized protein n=2 Tax=Eucalyptus grandis TaxID=71139 RepID=A0ACC3IVI0_EUCGR|nr:hypothetical protein EUGRSUZ_K01685 [Eucalyptus grandis]